MIYLSVIIPAYNEEKRLPKTLEKVCNYLENKKYEKEVIVVDDGSVDKTILVVDDLAQKFSFLRAVRNEINQGKAKSVNRGMLLAKGQIVLFMDADGSTSIEEVDKLIKAIDDGSDIAIGSRRVDGSNVLKDQSQIRLFLGWIFRHIVSFVLKMDIVDTQNGFKLFKNKVVKDVFSRQKSFGWAFDVEILCIATRSGYKIKEVPIVWVNDSESKVNFLGKIKMLFEVLKIRWGR